jgi:hypothetical protein
MSDMYDSDEFEDQDSYWDENNKTQLRIDVELHPSEIKTIEEHNHLQNQTMNELVTILLEDLVGKIVDDDVKKMVEKRNNRCLL